MPKCTQKCQQIFFGSSDCLLNHSTKKTSRRNCCTVTFKFWLLKGAKKRAKRTSPFRLSAYNIPYSLYLVHSSDKRTPMTFLKYMCTSTSYIAIEGRQRLGKIKIYLSFKVLIHHCILLFQFFSLIFVKMKVGLFAY